MYTRHILVPWANAKDLQKDGLKAQMGDLYPRWVGARDLFLQGKNPYSEQVSHEIQMAYYGHIVTPEESRSRIVDEQRFAYPLYVVFLMQPLIHQDFATVHLWAPWVLGTFAAVSVLFCLGMLDWDLRWSEAAALVLLVLSSPQVVQGIRHQQLALVVGCLVAAAGWSLHKGWPSAAGVLLAFSTIKPQMTLLLLAWFLLWVLGNWRARWRLVAGFGFTMILLVGGGSFFVRGWLLDFVVGVAAYRKYFPTTSVLRLLMGDVLGTIVCALIILWTLYYGWKNRAAESAAEPFVRVFATVLAVTVITFPLFTPFNQVLLILPALLLVHEWRSLPRFSRLTFLWVIFWPWMTSLLLLLLRTSTNPESRLPLIPASAASLVPLLLPVWLFTKRKAVEEQCCARALR